MTLGGAYKKLGLEVAQISRRFVSETRGVELKYY